MVKGVSKRVIVVRPPDAKIFEQAIFIIREDYAGQTGVSEQDVLREADRVANSYLWGERGRSVGGFRRLRGALYAMAGAAVTALAWFAVQFVHL